MNTLEEFQALHRGLRFSNQVHVMNSVLRAVLDATEECNDPIIAEAYIGILVNICAAVKLSDTLPYRTLFEPLPDGPGKGQCIGETKLDRMLDEYYACRGWDSNGAHTKATLTKYDLAEDVANR